MLTCISRTLICINCQHDWDITQYMYEDFVTCPACKYKNDIGVRITTSCCGKVVANSNNVIIELEV